MENKNSSKARTSSFLSIKAIISIFLFFLTIFLIHVQASPFYASWSFFHQWEDENSFNSNTNLRDSITFLPLKDMKFKETATTGNTWFMSSLNDTVEENEAKHLQFPSSQSNGRVLCIKGHDKKDGTKNSYVLAWPQSLPESAIFISGLTFVSETYYDYNNLWHGICAMAPFVGWSLKNQCAKPKNWVLFHRGEVRDKMGSWVQNLVLSSFGEVDVFGFGDADVPYCFEKAIVARHNVEGMGKAKKLEVFDFFRCKAREFCGVVKDVSVIGDLDIRITLLMRRGSRSFKKSKTVLDIFAKECAMVEGCKLKVAHSEGLSFCDQVGVMTNTDIVASPHGAQLTNMLFMDRNGSVMEFFPKGWLEHAGIGQYAHHWMADQSGMIHTGAWWEPIGNEKCPFPISDPRCFLIYKDGKVGHNETLFREWARRVIDQVRIRKLKKASGNSTILSHSNACAC